MSLFFFLTLSLGLRVEFSWWLFFFSLCVHNPVYKTHMSYNVFDWKLDILSNIMWKSHSYQWSVFILVTVCLFLDFPSDTLLYSFRSRCVSQGICQWSGRQFTTLAHLYFLQYTDAQNQLQLRNHGPLRSSLCMHVDCKFLGLCQSFSEYPLDIFPPVLSFQSLIDDLLPASNVA
jgi:hypothetical protein